MRSEEYQIITKYIYDVCGIALGDNKEYLISQRLSDIAEEFSCATLEDFAKLLQTRSFDSNLREKVVVAITTNETSFFRDNSPFNDFYQQILPGLTDLARERKARPFTRRGNKVSIWSAASSTGQEAYTISMLINEHLGTGKDGVIPEDFLITGTDISSEVLAKAISGEYTQSEIARGVSSQRLTKHFEQVDNKWVVKPHLRALVEFRQLNLVNSFTHLGGFDIIFCRNVLIYFDDDTKRSIFNQMVSMLSDDGILILGSAENIYGLCDELESFNCGNSIFYRKKKN